MNNYIKILSVLIFLFPGIVSASHNNDSATRDAHGHDRQKLIEQYDTNNDGVLSEQEREILRASMREARFQRFDIDGDGVLSDEEKNVYRQNNRRKGKTKGSFNKNRKHASPEARQRILERFDTDGDGVLSQDEKSAAREAMGEQHAVRREDFLERFDTDGDGQLSDDEKAAAHKAWKGIRKKSSGS